MKKKEYCSLGIMSCSSIDGLDFWLIQTDGEFSFDCLFTSVLIRAQLTGTIILKAINQNNIKIVENKALNERFYGDLQGMNKDECRQKWGE